jgi:PAS domain S-box-containing protein
LLLPKLLIPNDREFIIVDRDLTILEISGNAAKFAAFPEEIDVGNYICSGFPELIGIEDIFEDIFTEKKEKFVLEAINRYLDNNTYLYIDLTINKVDDRVVIWLDDTTKMMALEQFLVQRANETEVLLNALTISEDYLNKIVLFMGDALIVTTESGNIKKINKITEELFGYSESELLENSIFKIIDRIYFAIEKIYERPLETETFFQNIELNCKTKQNKTITVEFSCAAVRTEIKNVFDYIYVGRDITARKKAEEENLKALQKEREINHLRSRFTSMASHEFGNPLTSILLCLEQLNKGEFVECGGKVFVKAATEAAQRMEILVKDIIALGKADSGNLSFQPIKLNLKIFCQRLIEELEMNRKKRIIFLDSSNNKHFYLDPKLLHHILSNLLTNALKYSPETEIVELEISSCLDRQQVIFNIKDRGIGIPEEAQKYLCQSFYRADNVGDIAGSGLGLSIVKKSVDLHGGILKMESKQGIGTTVRVILPLDYLIDSKLAYSCV